MPEMIVHQKAKYGLLGCINTDRVHISITIKEMQSYVNMNKL